MLTLGHLLTALAGWPAEAFEIPISETVIDSREATPGAFFIALRGEKGDGHDHVGDAFANGAVAALIDRDIDADCTVLDLRTPPSEPPETLQMPVCLRVPDSLAALQILARYWRGRFHPRVVGVTGSVGKTTTKELIATVLGERYRTLKSELSYNNEIGLPLTLLGLTDAHERVVLEMGMYDVGEIAGLCAIARPHVGVVTLIAPVHLERAKTMERIIHAKTELVAALPPAPEGVAILNADDANVMGMAAHTQARIVTYGLTPEADLWADAIEGLGLEGIRFRLHHGGETMTIRARMLGRHSVHTALRAAAVGLVEGLSWDEIVRGLQTSASHLRLVAVRGPNGATILDDSYNASPDSVIAALNLLADLTPERRIAVLGDMRELGSYEETGHQRVGRRAALVVDVLVTVGELGRIIAREAVMSGMPPERVHAMATTDEAADWLIEEVRGGDAVLVKGSLAMGMARIVDALTKAAEDS
jgi:UDP-N-acetylmuramoyl-tripeptide--D-alanyl-D-alanine ligase